MNKRIVISGAKSNSGKTTVSLGLLRLLNRKNIDVQPFKSGPDYIDPKFHELAAGNTGVNLDTYMMSDKHINNCLSDFSNQNTIQCIEGVMGLFDGANKSEGSTAELAKKIKASVVLVVDAKSVAYSVAPLIQGFVNFDKELDIIGVIFNRVGSERHYEILKEACNDINIKSFGYLRVIKEANIPSRHLGLNISDITKFDRSIDLIADEIDQNVDWQLLLELTHSVPKIKSVEKFNPKSKIKFAVARDEAFNFIYPQTIKAMNEIGRVEYFSPINDVKLPVVDFIYIPGGYPELYLDKLSKNNAIKSQLLDFAQNGGLVFAECGGMMYLGKEVIDKNGEAHKLVGYFDFTCSIDKPKLHLGYRKIEWGKEKYKGHEFHYSSINDNNIEDSLGIIKNARSQEVNTKMFIKNNVLASYIHLYVGEASRLETLIKQILN